MQDPDTFSSLFTNLLSFFGLSGTVAFTNLERVASTVWLWIIILGYLASFAGLAAIVWMLMRLFDLRKREGEYYDTLIPAPESEQGLSPRWRHIEELSLAASPSAWREAIIEADIMLDDILARRGYTGEGVGEKLRQIERGDMSSLNDAWEAHKVRNQIAHEGSAFDLSETLASRTIARYQAVFHELGVV